MEIINRLIPAGDDGIRVMILVSITIFILFLIVFLSATKFFYSVWKEDKILVQEIHERVGDHDNNIKAMLMEMKANRESDNRQAEITRKLVIFLARKSNIEMPEL
jgi:uncharacterized membrane protein YvbJ